MEKRRAQETGRRSSRSAETCFVHALGFAHRAAVPRRMATHLACRGLMGWRGMTLRPQPLMSLQAGACRLQNQGPKVRARRAEPAVEILAQAIVARADRR